MELLVNLPDSLYAKIQEQVDNEHFASQRELVETALEYFLCVKQNTKELSLKSPDELSEDERMEYRALLRTDEKVALSRHQHNQ